MDKSIFGDNKRDIQMIEKLNADLNQIKDKYDIISNQNKVMKKFIDKNKILQKRANDLISDKDWRLIKTVIIDTTFHLKGTGADNQIKDFLQQLIELYSNRIKEFKTRLPLNINYNKKLKSISFRNKTLEEICSADPLWARQNEAQEVRPCVCPLGMACLRPQSYYCIAYCYKSFADKFENKFSHFAIYSAIHGIAIPSYDSDGRPKPIEFQPKDIPKETVLAIDIEFITDKSNDSYAARIALMANRAVVFDTKQRSDNNIKNLVFHALIRHKDMDFDLSTSKHFHIRTKEHTKQFWRTCDQYEAMDLLKDYFNRFTIVFKNFNSDFRVLLWTGFPFEPQLEEKDFKVYDIERFYRRLLTDKITGHTSDYPFSLKWLNEYFLLNKSQSKASVHCPVEDSRNTLALFKRLTTVIEDPENSTGSCDKTNYNKRIKRFGQPLKKPIKRLVASTHALKACRLSRDELIWFKTKETERMKSRKEKIHSKTKTGKDGKVSQIWDKKAFKRFIESKYLSEMSQNFACDLIDD